jgi:hypothetical protein
MRIPAFILAAATLIGCYGHTDFVVVEPKRYVSPPPQPIPNSQFGWVTTTPDLAERYLVRVGDLTYQRIIEPHRVNGQLTQEAAINALAAFAEQEVVRKKYCASAETPKDARKLIGSNTPPEMHIIVVCIKKNGA